VAASYQTGVSTSPINLLQTLVTWLVGQGWTTDLSAADGPGWRAHLHKGGQYVNLRAAMNEKIFPGPGGQIDWTTGYGLGLYLGTGHSGAAAWNAQAGAPTTNNGHVTGAGASLPSGAVSAYHFFDDGSDHITVVVEKAPAKFVHFGWGPRLVKTGTSEDFWYFFGSSPAAYVTAGATVTGPGLSSTAHAPFAHSFIHSLYVDGTAFVRADAITWPARWVSNSGTTSAPTPGSEYGWTGLDGRCVLNESTNSFDLQEGQYPSYLRIKGRVHQVAFVGALLLPLHFFVEAPTARWAPVGYPPTVFFTTAVGNGFGATEVYQVGGLNYMVFPSFAVRKAA